VDLAAPKTKTAASLTHGYLICVIATFFWAFTGIFIGYLIQTYRMPALVLAFWRDAFVALGLATFFVLASPGRLWAPRARLAFLALFGLTFSLFNALWTASVGLNGAAVSTVLAYSSPAYTVLLGWRLFSERVDLAKVAAVTLSLLGCVLVSGAYDPLAWQVNAFGIALGLLSGIGFATYSLMGKAASRQGLDSWSTLLYTFGFGALFLLVANLVVAWWPGMEQAPGLFWLGNSWAGWGILVVLALVPTIGGFGLYTASLAYLPVSVANLIATLEPVITAILAYALLGERFSGPQMLGSALIISAVIILRFSQDKRPASEML